MLSACISPGSAAASGGSQAASSLSVGRAAGSTPTAAPGAQAGGDFVDLVVDGTHLWFVGPLGVRVVDARSGRTLSRPQLVGAAYPLSVTLAGGAAWVASVENGYVWGTLSRIDVKTGRVRVVWRRRGSSVQYVAAPAASGR